jgi:hypothetical protein
MTYEEAIQTLSRTPFDVSYSAGVIQVWENIGGELVKRKDDASSIPFNGDWEEAIVIGTERVGELQQTPYKKRRSRSRRKKT